MFSTLYGDGYSYGFNGQETDNEWLDGAIGYEFRITDPRIGRFLSIDPLFKKFAQWSPYQFSGNQVINTQELEGLEPSSDANADINATVSLVIQFGSTNQEPVLSLNAGVGASLQQSSRGVYLTQGLNLSLSLYNTGLGTPSASTGESETQVDLVITPLFSVGAFEANRPMQVNLFHESHTSGIYSNTGLSYTYATNFVTNSNGRNQTVGNHSVRIGSTSFNIYNDIEKYFGGDGDDRWWSGGGQIDYMFENGSVLSIGTEVFTGEFQQNEDGSHQVSDDNEANGNNGTALQSDYQKSYNNGQTYVQLTLPNMNYVQLRTSGQGNGWSQNFIHNDVVPTPVFDYSLSEFSLAFEASLLITP